MIAAYLLGAVVFLLFAFKLYMSRNDGFWKKTGFPTIHPKYVESLFKRIISKSAFHEIDQKIYRGLKEDNLPYAGIVEMGTPLFVCRDLDLIKKIYVKDFDNFVNRRGFQTKKTDPHFYKMLFNMEDNKWRSLRTTMSPTFTTGKIRRMFEHYDRCGGKLVKFLSTEIGGSSGDLNLRDAVSRYTMDVIASSAFGVESKMFEDSKSTFAQMARKFQTQFDGFGLIKFFMLLVSPKLMEILDIGIFDREADKFFSNVILSALRHRGETNEKRDDFLQLMLEARKGTLKTDEKELDTFEKEAMLKDEPSKLPKVELDDDMIVSQSILFLLAGFDTAETLLTFTTYILATNQEVKEKLTKAVDAAFKKDGGKLTYDTINSVEYLDNFISETLRMYPPAVRTERRAAHDYKLPDSDLVLPKGTVVTIPVYSIHHDEEYWPEPEKFDPDRFLPENKQKQNPYAWQPFGHGPRNCIGMRFALMEAKAAIAHMVHNFDFAPCKKTHIPMVFSKSGNLKPVDGMWLNVRARVK